MTTSGTPSKWSKTSLVILVAGALPRDQLVDGGAGARDRVLVGLDFLPRGVFAHSADAVPDFLVLRIHREDLEVVFAARLEIKGLAVAVESFGVMAKAFHTLDNLNECAEGRYAQDFPVQHIADVVLFE